MDILIRIPDKEVPKQQKLVPIDLHFVDGHLTEASGYGFQELPKGHGDLKDVTKIIQEIAEDGIGLDTADREDNAQIYALSRAMNIIADAPIIIPANKGELE